MKHNESLILADRQKSCLGETSSYVPQEFRFTFLLPRERSHLRFLCEMKLSDVCETSAY